MTNDNTRIEWTDATWNPTTGCSKVSAGCANCYAEAVSTRFGHTTKPWTHPFAAENVRLRPERIEQPLRWRRPRRIFVDSMSDLFHEQVPDEYINRVFGVMWRAHWHTFQVLTKRPERMRDYIDRVVYVTDLIGDGDAARLPDAWPLPNVWLGTSVEDQRAADERILPLLDTPATVRFLSCEPLLGPVDLCHSGDDDFSIDALTGEERYAGNVRRGIRPGIDWVIVGGESGPKHRPFDPDWARSLRDHCVSANVPYFFKQHGGRTPKAGGRDLDGRTWDEMPAHLPTDRLAAPAA